jgi:hypothetical protein
MQTEMGTVGNLIAQQENLRLAKVMNARFNIILNAEFAVSAAAKEVRERVFKLAFAALPGFRVRHAVDTETFRCTGCRKTMCLKCGGCSGQCTHAMPA